MGVYVDFAAFVEENGKLVDSVTYPLVEKMTYWYRGYLIMLDLGKPAEESRVVAVMKDGKFVYASKFVVVGSLMLRGFAPDPKLANPEILSKLLEEWRGKNGGEQILG